MQNQTNPQIVQMKDEHLDDVVAIELESFQKESREDFLKCLNRSEVYSYFVLIGEKSEVLGYFGIMNISGEGELLTIAVKSEHRGKGYGAIMLESAILSSSLKGSEKIFLEVNEKNTPARSLYEKFGFVVISKREKYYGEDDAIIMQYNIKSAK